MPQEIANIDKAALCLMVFQQTMDVHKLLRKRDHTPAERRLKRKLLELIKRFNDRPYVCRCAVKGCKSPIDFPLLDPESLVVTPLCLQHRHEHLISSPGALFSYSLVSYRAILSSAASVKNPNAATFTKLVRTVAELKGLPPGRLTETRAVEFFAEPTQSSPKR